MKPYVVYVTTLGDEVLYIGSGVQGRESHVVKGVSHIPELNKDILTNDTVTKIVATSSQEEDIRLLEEILIGMFLPTYNTRGKNISKSSLLVKLECLFEKIYNRLTTFGTAKISSEGLKRLFSYGIPYHQTLIHDIAVINVKGTGVRSEDLLVFNTLSFEDSSSMVGFDLMTLDVLVDKVSPELLAKYRDLSFRLKHKRGYDYNEYCCILNSLIFEDRLKYSPLSYLFKSQKEIAA